METRASYRICASGAVYIHHKKERAGRGSTSPCEEKDPPDDWPLPAVAPEYPEAQIQHLREQHLFQAVESLQLRYQWDRDCWAAGESMRAREAAVVWPSVPKDWCPTPRPEGPPKNLLELAAILCEEIWERRQETSEHMDLVSDEDEHARTPPIPNTVNETREVIAEPNNIETVGNDAVHSHETGKYSDVYEPMQQSLQVGGIEAHRVKIVSEPMATNQLRVRVEDDDTSDLTTTKRNVELIDVDGDVGVAGAIDEHAADSDAETHTRNSACGEGDASTSTVIVSDKEIAINANIEDNEITDDYEADDEAEMRRVEAAPKYNLVDETESSESSDEDHEGDRAGPSTYTSSAEGKTSVNEDIEVREAISGDVADEAVEAIAADEASESSRTLGYSDFVTADEFLQSSDATDS